MLNTFLFHVASGQAFVSGVVLIAASVLSRRAGRGRRIARAVGMSLGLALVTISSTPLPPWFLAVAFGLSAGWLVVGGSEKSGRWLRPAVAVAWGVGLVVELPSHRWPSVPLPPGVPLYVVGDSLSAGMGGEVETWPTILARAGAVDVRDLSQAGATASTALRDQVPRAVGPPGLAVVEIGGNDLLGGGDAHDFERDLDALLGRLRGAGHLVVMFELPLPPFCAGFGAAQRRAARRHGVGLIPKRVLAGVLLATGATLDTIHLSPTGHRLMAGTVGGTIGRPAGPGPDR